MLVWSCSPGKGTALVLGSSPPLLQRGVVNDDFLAKLSNLKHRNLSGDENPTCRKLRGFVRRRPEAIRDGIRNFPED